MRQGKIIQPQQYLSDCELPDSIQPWGIGDDAYISPKDADTAALVSDAPGHWPYRSIFRTEKEGHVGGVCCSSSLAGSRAGHQDFWEVHDNCTLGGRKGTTEYRRVHRQPRQALFTPVNTQCPIDPNELDDLRVTRMQSVVPFDSTHPTQFSTSSSQIQQHEETIRDCWRDSEPDPHLSLLHI